MDKSEKLKPYKDEYSLEDFWLSRADGIVRLNPFICVGKYNVIDVKEIYKYPDLKQTDYEIILPIQEKIILGKKVGEYEYHSKTAIKVEEIRIRFKNGKEETLTSYINNKLGLPDLYTIIHSKGTKEKVNYDEISSKILNQLLSVLCRSNNSWIFSGGNNNIFESKELLDQLLITSLFINSRWGDKKSHLILYTLIRDRIKKFSKMMFRHYYIPCDENSEIELMDSEIELLELTSNIILDKNNLPKRYKYSLNNKVSFYYHMTGGLTNTQENEKTYHSVIKQYIRDNFVKDRKQEDFQRKNISLDKIVKDDEGSEIKIIDKYTKIEAEAKNKEATISFELIKHKLTKEEQDIFQMRIFEALNLEEIGKKLGIQKSAVSKRLNKVIEKVKSIINK